MNTSVCKFCGINLVREDARWVDAQDGGVYNWCTGREYDDAYNGHSAVTA